MAIGSAPRQTTSAAGALHYLQLMVRNMKQIKDFFSVVDSPAVWGDSPSM